MLAKACARPKDSASRIEDNAARAIVHTPLSYRRHALLRRKWERQDSGVCYSGAGMAIRPVTSRGRGSCGNDIDGQPTSTFIVVRLMSRTSAFRKPRQYSIAQLLDRSMVTAVPTSALQTHLVSGVADSAGIYDDRCPFQAREYVGPNDPTVIQEGNIDVV